MNPKGLVIISRHSSVKAQHDNILSNRQNSTARDNVHITYKQLVLSMASSIIVAFRRLLMGGVGQFQGIEWDSRVLSL